MTGDYPTMPIYEPAATLQWVDNFKEQCKRFAIVKIEFDSYSQLLNKQGFTAAEAAFNIYRGALDRGFASSKIILRTGVSTLEMLVSVKEKEERENIIKHLRTSITTRSDRNIRLSCVLYPDDSKGSEELLKRLDDLMPSAKRVHSGGEHDQIDFVEEIQNKKIVTYVQGVYKCDKSLKSRHILRGVELLARWHSPHGLLGPSEFIDSLNLQGAGKVFVEYLLSEAFATRSKLSREFGDNIIVTFNIDSATFIRPDIVKVFENFAEINDVSRIEIELADGNDADFGAIEAVFRKLSEKGYHFSLDGFGGRYSWLNLLDLGVTALKLDRSLTKRIVKSKAMGALVSADIGTEVLSAILKLASSDLDVIAEGIESKVEHDILIDQGVTAVQGFWIGRPAPIDTFIEDSQFLKRLDEHPNASLFEPSKHH